MDLWEKKLDNLDVARYKHANENRFAQVGINCRNLREAVFDHIVDHILIWTTWRQWIQEFRKASVSK